MPQPKPESVAKAEIQRSEFRRKSMSSNIRYLALGAIPTLSTHRKRVSVSFNTEVPLALLFL
jgi:hypothetical protein